MTLSLWTEASRDLEAEHVALRMVGAKVAVAGLWPFLSLAQSPDEFEHRLALAWDHIANAVPVDLLQPVADSLREDHRIVAAKNAEGEESADGDSDDADSSGMPDWLQSKIKGEGAYYHRGRREWVAARHACADPARFWHQGAGRWVVAVVEEQAGGGNPYYFTGGPEAGPATGMTNQFAPHPTGMDPIDPINQTYPAQSQPWTVTPSTEWKEQPMNFDPPGGHQAVKTGDTGVCASCNKPVRHEGGLGWMHHGFKQAWMMDDDHTPTPKKTAGGQNPNYFAGGSEGATGDPQSSFPDDPSAEDPDDRVNELYGASPISGGMVDNGNRVQGRRIATTPHHPAPDSDPLMGTEFDSPEERERWGKAQRGEDPGSRDSTATVGSRLGFYDLTDPSVRVLGMGEQYSGDQNPFNMGPDATAPAGASGPGMSTNVPQTTPPRQMPGGGGGDMSGMGDAGGGESDTDTSDSAAKSNNQTTGRRRVHGESRELGTDADPTGYGDEFEHNIYEQGRGPLNTHPRQGPEHRNVNTPQQPAKPIRTVDSRSPTPSGEEDEDNQREAARVASMLTRELVMS